MILHNVEDHVITADIALYLRAELSRIADEFEVPSPSTWHSSNDLALLVQRSDKLFVYAATVIRFIADDEVRDPISQLKIVLGSEADEDANPTADLDAFYLEVLRNATKKSQRKHVAKRLRLVVGTIILLRDPLSIPALASLLDIPETDVFAALHPLHSLIVQTDRDPPRTYHKSFPDFITDPTRCTDSNFRIDLRAHHGQLAHQCFITMEIGLKKNILGLSDPFLPNAEVPHFADKMDFGFPTKLRYACRYWVSHLLEATVADNSELMRRLEGFALRSILRWIEAMSLLGEMSLAASILQQAYQYVVSVLHSSRL